MISDADLEPTVIAYCVPPLKQGGGRVRPLFRIKRVGVVYFVEGMQYARDPNGELIETWKNLAVSKGDTAMKEAFEWMHTANLEAMKLSKSK